MRDPLPEIKLSAADTIKGLLFWGSCGTQISGPDLKSRGETIYKKGRGSWRAEDPDRDRKTAYEKSPGGRLVCGGYGVYL